MKRESFLLLLPFLVLIFFILFIHFAIQNETIASVSFLSLLLLFFLLGYFYPFFVKSLLKCSSLKNEELKTKLLEFARKQKCPCKDILVWESKDIPVTAATFGNIFANRYILFTSKLLDSLSEEEILAVFAHEIGHIYHYHVFFHFLLLIGLFVGEALLLSVISPLPFITQLLGFVTFAFLYIRFLVGFFSRQFESQADLFLFSCSIPVKDLISAFEKISFLNSLPMKKTTWHHGSLHNRVLLLKKADEDRKYQRRQNLLLKVSLFAYLLFLSAMFYFWIIKP